jgi:hypothetical protein
MSSSQVAVTATEESFDCIYYNRDNELMRPRTDGLHKTFSFSNFCMKKFLSIKEKQTFVITLKFLTKSLRKTLTNLAAFKSFQQLTKKLEKTG